MAGSRGFFEYIGADIIKAPIQNFADQFSNNLIPAITPILIIGLTLYYVLKGYLAMTGRSQDAIMEILIHGFKVALIAYIFINTGNFQIGTSKLFITRPPLYLSPEK